MAEKLADSSFCRRPRHLVLAASSPCSLTWRTFVASAAPPRLAELDRLDPQLLRQLRLVLPNLADHRIGCLALEEELNALSVWALTTP